MHKGLRGLALGAVLGLGMIGTVTTHAAAAGINSVIAVVNDTVDVFDADGNFKTELKKADITIPTDVLAHNHDKNILKVVHKGEEIWIDESAVTLKEAKTSKVECRPNPTAKPKDQQTASALGLSPCTK